MIKNSSNDYTLYFVSVDGGDFIGNLNGEPLVEHTLSPPIVARYIRLFPTETGGVYASMRWELYGCL